MRRRRGNSLLEMLLATSMLGLLIVTVLEIYLMGSRAANRGDTQSDLMRNLQAGSAHLVTEIESSAYAGLTVEPDAVSIEVASDADGKVELDDQGLPQWKRYLLYYHNSTEQTLVRCEVDVPAALAGTAAPLESMDDGTGPHPLSYYRTGGRVLAHHLYALEATRSGHLVQLYLGCEKQCYGKSDPERLVEGVTVRLRN